MNFYCFTAPAEKSIEELQKLDESDEALKRYKGKTSENKRFHPFFVEQLLGNVESAKSTDSRRVVVKKILLNSKDLPSPLTMDLSDTSKKQSFKIKGDFYHFSPFLQACIQREQNTRSESSSK